MAGLQDAIHRACIQESRRGNQERLVTLLRSDEPLPRKIREYIADQLELSPQRRFRRTDRRSSEVEQNDRSLLYRLAIVKLELRGRRVLGICSKGQEWILPYLSGEKADARLDAIRWHDVTDREALDLLQERGREIHQEDLNNAFTRRRQANPLWDEWLKQTPLTKFYYA